jgi:2-haloacid dehalogenase
MFELLEPVRDHLAPWVNADVLHRQALDDLADSYAQLNLSADDRDGLNMAWHRMPVWPSFPPALERMRVQYPCVVLTLLSYAIAMDSSRLNGLQWDGIISCEFLGSYKPDPEAYRAGCRLLGQETGNVMMVASHPSDLRGARAAGMLTAFVTPHLSEPDQAGDDSPPRTGEFDVVASDFSDLANRLCGGPE